jgi:hypothetical protein
MSAIIQHDHGVAQFFKSASASVAILVPSMMTGMYLIKHYRAPLHAPFQIVCLILLLASVNLGTVIMIDAYRNHFSKLTPPALISMITTVLLFVVTESFNRFFDNHIGYGFLTPLVIACIGFIYANIIVEKNIVMKFFLSLNSIAVMFLWALGSADKFTMPF